MPTPMQLTAPNEQMSSNILAGLTGDILKKVTKNIIDTTSQHATEAIQAGVPYGHILDQLLKMAPAGANLQGGGAPPPGGPIGDGGGPPPKGPAPMAKRAEGDVAMVPTQQVPTQPDVPQQQQQPQPQDILTALLASMQGGSGQQMQMPSFLGIKPSAQNQVLLTQAAQGQQKLAGQEPIQIGDIQKMIAGVGAEKMKAEVVPPTQYEKGQQAAAAYTAQLDNAQKQVQALNDEEARATANFTAMMNSRSAIGKTVGSGGKDAVAQLKAQLDDISARRDKANAALLDLYGKHPNLKKPDATSSKELIGKTIGKYKLVSVK